MLIFQLTDDILFVKFILREIKFMDDLSFYINGGVILVENCLKHNLKPASMHYEKYCLLITQDKCVKEDTLFAFIKPKYKMVSENILLPLFMYSDDSENLYEFFTKEYLGKRSDYRYNGYEILEPTTTIKTYTHYHGDCPEYEVKPISEYSTFLKYVKLIVAALEKRGIDRNKMEELITTAFRNDRIKIEKEKLELDQEKNRKKEEEEISKEELYRILNNHS